MIDFSADLPIFLADFGVPCSVGATTFTAKFDMPGHNPMVFDVELSATDYTITYQTGAVTLKKGDSVTVNGAPYVVLRPPKKISDGAFSVVNLGL